MIRRLPRTRSGITLTEILIAMFIMAIGLISLASLFPIGLMRLKAAARMSRSAYLVESAAADLEARNLLSKLSFLNTYGSGPFYVDVNGAPYDPWIQDTPGYRQPLAAGGLNIQYGPGLPVAYDPLWRSVTGIYPSGSQPIEARFASGIGFLRNDPNPGGASSLASAHGLQRLTNFNPLIYTALGAQASTLRQQQIVEEIFVSPEDVVLNDGTIRQPNGRTLSPLLPDLTLNSGQITRDYRFTWMFTGYQTDALNGSVFDGEIVVFENRPFALDTVNGAPFVAGETVVEAIFGYSKNVYPPSGGKGYGVGADKVVMLRWPASQPDPEVKVGNWVADVTYERWQKEDLDPDTGTGRRADAPATGPVYPYQRCYWYQIVKKSEAGPDTVGDAATKAGYRSMTVWVGTPLRAQTLLDPTGAPYHVNAALVSPYVANVYPRTIYTR